MRGLCKSSSPSTVVSPKGGTRGPSFNAKQVIQTSCSHTDALTSCSYTTHSHDAHTRVPLSLMLFY